MSAVLKETIPESLSVNLVMTPDIRTQLTEGQSAESKALADAQAFEIDCNEVAEIESADCKALAAGIDKLKALRTDFVKPAKDIIESANNLFNPAIEGMTRAREIKLGRIKVWMQKEQARIAQENAEREAQARKARQEAEQKAAAERARAEQQAAEQRRIAQEAETKRLEAEAAGNARAAAAAAAEAAKANEKAQAVIETGEAKAVQAQLEAASQPVAAAPVKAVAPAGVTMKDNWVAKLKPNVTEDQAKALIAAASVERPDLLALLKVDTSAIGKLAKALKGSMNVPGYAAVNEQTMAGSRK